MWIRALGGLGIVLALFLLSIPAWVVWQSQDLPGIDDADLLPVLHDLPAERDAFALLERAAALLVDGERHVAPALAGDRAALAALAPLVEANAPALAALETALAAPEFQVPLPESIDDPGPDLRSWRRLAQLLRVRGLLRGSGSEAGLADLLAALELSRRIETARGGGLITAVTGISIRNAALDSLERWIAGSRPSAAEARVLARRLGGYRSDAGAWARAVGVEYANMKRFVLQGLEDMRNGEVPGEEMQALHQLIPVRYYFHANRTFQGFAERFRVAAANGGRVCAELESAPGSAELEGPSPLRILLSPNGGGQVLLAVGTPDYHSYQYRRCAVDSHLAALQAMVALRAWQLERGELPTTLDELVPEFLEAVPVDAFDGRPLRYDRQRAWLYSVGDDLRDAGGRAAGVGDGDTSEPTFPLRFAEVAPEAPGA